MNINVNIHLHGNEYIELKSYKSEDDGHEYCTLSFDLDGHIFGSKNDMRKINEALNKGLYDGPTYEELENKIYELQAKLEELQDENDYLRELEERMGF